MNRHKKQKADPREVLTLAEQAASKRDFDEALRLFDVCIQDYLKKNMPFRAIAVAKRARSALGPIPKVRSLIIRLYNMTGLYGDAQQEYRLAASSLKKDEIPLFKTLDEEAFLDLLSAAEIVPVQKGRTVLKEHQKGDDVFVVLSGTLEVFRDSIRLGTLGPGDVLGELGFFCKGERSATVKAIERGTLIRIPSAPLIEIQQRHPCLRQALDIIYGQRILKKVQEDLGDLSHAFVKQEVVATLRYSKGQNIPMDTHGTLAVIKHGIVEIDYDENALKRKEHLKAGSIIPKGKVRARASTNVVILLTRMQQEHEPGTKGPREH